MHTLDYAPPERNPGSRRAIVLAVIAGLAGFLLFRVLHKPSATLSVPVKAVPLGPIAASSPSSASHLQEGANVMYGEFHVAAGVGSRVYPTESQPALTDVLPSFFVLERTDDLRPMIISAPSTQPSANLRR